MTRNWTDEQRAEQSTKMREAWAAGKYKPHGLSVSRTAASLGGLTTAARMTDDERSERARKASLARQLQRLERGEETRKARVTRDRLAKWDAAFARLEDRLRP